MAHKFPSDQWIKALRKVLNNSESYQRSAKDWEGDFVFVAEPDDVFPETVYMHLQLYHGSIPGAELENYGFNFIREDLPSETSSHIFP
ncbi:MAG: hypothetical protein E4H33_03505 [Anaerolineales bacterium]|nr:MAG: hypothetical protein E4H33_03505 [Anaerolineales bacterium]